MFVDLSRHCRECMRTARREGVPSFRATDSVTSPENTAFRGKTTPLTSVAITSFASIFVPTGVFPAWIFCCITTGNSWTGAPACRDGVVEDCARAVVDDVRRQDTERPNNSTIRSLRNIQNLTGEAD